tara:strand:- start:367 stop:1323 length:957 start_codon:yes stop_codon:yes gene_type:complete
MAVYSPITKIELESFLKQYSIGSLITFEGILEGIENTNYKIKTSNNMYILTIFEKRVNPDDLPFFINLKNHLSKKKFECPKPISNKEGKYINFIKNKYCIITSFLDGKKTSAVKNDHCKQVGEMLALFHQKSKDFKETRNNTMNQKQWKNLFLKSKKVPNNKFHEIMSNIENELIYLKKIWPKNLPKGIIHADVFQDNVFFKKNKISGLIDFYFSCNDFFAYDLALTINAWCFDNQFNFEEKKFLHLIKGYESLRKLELIEKKNLSTLLRGGAIRILLTRIHDLLHHPDGAYVEPKDPKEFIYILQFHQNNNLNDFLL